MTEINASKRPVVVVAGANGFLGRHLTSALVGEGYLVRGLVREGRQAQLLDHPAVQAVVWDARGAGPWSEALQGAAAIVNLVGRSVDCVKSARNKQDILQSRVESVRAIGQACREVDQPPPVWLQAGTAHIIGDPEPPDTLCDDDTPPPTHGLAPMVGQAWEEAFEEQLLEAQRGVVLRISFVVGPGGGALARLVPLTRIFLGGTVGSGRQWMSWLHIDDLNRLWLAALCDATLSGTYMATSPEPVTNRAFMRALRQACGRPWSPPAPAWAVRLVARWILRSDPELALLGRRIVPSRLLHETEFTFRWPDLGPALQDIMDRWNKSGSQPASVD